MARGRCWTSTAGLSLTHNVSKSRAAKCTLNNSLWQPSTTAGQVDGWLRITLENKGVNDGPKL